MIGGLQLGHQTTGTLERLDKAQALGQGIGKVGLAEPGEVLPVLATERSTVCCRGSDDQRMRITQGLDVATGVAGRNDDDLPFHRAGRQHRCQGGGRELRQSHWWHLHTQLVLWCAMTGEIEHQQVILDVHHFTQRAQAVAQIGRRCQGQLPQRRQAIGQGQ